MGAKCARAGRRTSPENANMQTGHGPVDFTLLGQKTKQSRSMVNGAKLYQGVAGGSLHQCTSRRHRRRWFRGPGPCRASRPLRFRSYCGTSLRPTCARPVGAYAGHVGGKAHVLFVRQQAVIFALLSPGDHRVSSARCLIWRVRRCSITPSRTGLRLPHPQLGRKAQTKSGVDPPRLLRRGSYRVFITGAAIGLFNFSA